MKQSSTVLGWCLVAGIAMSAAIPAAHAGLLSSDSDSETSHWSLRSRDLETSASAQNASVLLVSRSELVVGDDPSVTMIDVPGPGELLLTTTDLDFPNPLAELQLDVIGPTGPLMSLSGSGTLTLDVTKPETLYAEVFPVAQDGPALGLYNFQASLVAVAPVPLPPSGLLLGGVVLLGVALRQGTTALRSRQLS